MASKEKILLLSKKEKFGLIATQLYGDCDIYKMAERYINLGAMHIRQFGVNELEYFSSPGRIEVCGNHTDHNNGKVLCASITVDILAAVTRTQDNLIRVASQGYPIIEVDLESLDKKDNEKGTSTALVRGVCKYLKAEGYKLGGLVATTTSDVFKGAGVSSSAAFEVLIAEIISCFYNDSKIDAVTKAKASQWAESYYFEKPCGLMDQSAIALGGVSYIDFKDINQPKIEKIDWLFEDMDIILVNTGGDHSTLTSHYAKIREDMGNVANFFGQEVLRCVDKQAFFDSIAPLKKQFCGRTILRAIHFFEENQRVDSCALAIKDKQSSDFVKFVNESGDSSCKLLQNCYAPQDESQCIPLAVELAKRREGVLAARVHGGGFAGTILVFVAKKYTHSVLDYLYNLYGKENVFDVSVRNVGATFTNLRLVKEQL